MNGISTIDYKKVSIIEERWTDMDSSPRVSVHVNAGRGGDFLTSCASVDEAKAWVDAGKPTVTKRYVDGNSKTFRKR
jgi:hypothetical protein